MWQIWTPILIMIILVVIFFQCIILSNGQCCISWTKNNELTKPVSWTTGHKKFHEHLHPWGMHGSLYCWPSLHVCWFWRGELFLFRVWYIFYIWSDWAYSHTRLETLWHPTRFVLNQYCWGLNWMKLWIFSKKF